MCFTLSYDANGNQTTRTVNGQTLRQAQGIAFNLSYDAENRLVSVTGPNVTASFVYDGDGRQMKSTINGVTTTFVGVHYQIVNGTVTKYYFAGATRIAMRTGSTLTYLLGDHLGSTSLTTDDLGNFVSELRYKPWGETRYSSGTTATSYRYTGQREEVSFGLYFYNARWYDPALGRFAQADSIVPPGVQGWDRYTAMNNNPVRYTDPSGHVVCEVGEPCGPGATYVPETSYEQAAKYIKEKIIKERFGVTLSDYIFGTITVGKVWDAHNILLVYARLGHLDVLFRGKLKSIIERAGGAIFDMDEYVATRENCPQGGCTYSGLTNGTHITFFTTGSRAINTMNFYHEFGHMINSLSGNDNIFSDQLDALDNPSFISNNYVNTNALLGLFAEPIQASNSTVTEQWGDVFANYAAGNINLSNPNGPGAEMYGFIAPALEDFLRGY